MKVYILDKLESGEAYCDLVFETIMIGFPTFKVIRDMGLGFKTHADWIKYLIQTNDEPFIICDKDIVFYENMEEDFIRNQNKALYGRLLPQFYDIVSKATSLKRFHPSLLLLNPKYIKERIKNAEALSYSTDVKTLLIDSFYFYCGNMRFFSDTMASLTGLLVFCQSFTEKELDKYCHLFCGTFLNKATKFLGPEFERMHKQVTQDSNLGKGLWRQQEKYFLSVQC